MDVPVIAMSVEEAEEKLRAWNNEKHADARVAREDCIKGYQALAEGKTLVHLDAAIREGGRFESGLPKLAIARADRKIVRFEWSPGTTTCTFDARQPDGHGSYRRGNPGTLARRVDMRHPHGRTRKAGEHHYGEYLQGWAQVPIVPADVRPASGQLKDWFILWEVERWFDRPTLVEPDKDPLLLEHVAGQFYAVLAEWELTELERAVMAGALRPEVT